MTTRSLLLVFALLALPAAGHAACFADYRAKQDKPLRFHYGVVKVSDGACPSTGQAQADIERRIARDDWQLVGVLGLFDEEGLTEKRRADAGGFFLRY